MRILHARADLLGGGHDSGVSKWIAKRRDERRIREACRALGRGNQRANERQFVPVRGIPRHPHRHSYSLSVGGDTLREFTYSRAVTLQEALTRIAPLANGKFLGGGTNLIDLMRENIERPGYRDRRYPPVVRNQ